MVLRVFHACVCGLDPKYSPKTKACACVCPVQMLGSGVVSSSNLLRPLGISGVDGRGVQARPPEHFNSHPTLCFRQPDDKQESGAHHPTLPTGPLIWCTIWLEKESIGKRAEYCFESTVSQEGTHCVLRQTRSH